MRSPETSNHFILIRFALLNRTSSSQTYQREAFPNAASSPISDWPLWLSRFADQFPASVRSSSGLDLVSHAIHCQTPLWSESRGRRLLILETSSNTHNVNAIEDLAATCGSPVTTPLVCPSVEWHDFEEFDASVSASDARCGNGFQIQ